MKQPSVARKVPRGFPLIVLGLVVCTLGLIVCGFHGCSGGSSAPPPLTSTTPTSTTPTAVTAPAFPLVALGNRRYLQDQKGVPFPILGRTAWFITSLSETDYKMFIDDTAAKGYNAIEFHVVNHDARGNNEPFGGNGALPFSKRLDGAAWTGSLSYGNINNEAPDFSLPNEAYWQHVDALLAYAESKGMLCFLVPAYAGNGGGAEGWMAEMTANGVSKMTAYGAFIATRYKNRGNIVWMLGGDYDRFTGAGELVVEQALLAGMQSIGGQASRHFSAEWSSESIYTDQADATLRAAGTLQGAYSFRGNVNTYARNGYGGFDSDGTTPHAVLPTFLLEEPYDEEGSDGNSANPFFATQPVRRFQWWGWFSGIGGYISGNGYVWPFNPGWQAHLNTPGAQDMARLNAFVRSIAWYNLVPSGLGVGPLVVGKTSPSSPDYVAAAATPDGTLLVAYVPPAYLGPTITIDMTAMNGPTRARWFDPTTAAYTDAGVFLPPLGTQVLFTLPPVSHGDKFTDWVLLLEKQ